MENKKFKIKVYVSKGMTDIPIYETDIEDLTNERIGLMHLKQLGPFKEDAYIMLDISLNDQNPS